MLGGDRILGRERELAAIAAFLDEPPPTALVIAGAAGTGKSTLLAAATERAGGRGARVLTASPGERETDLPLAALERTPRTKSWKPPFSTRWRCTVTTTRLSCATGSARRSTISTEPSSSAQQRR